MVKNKFDKPVVVWLLSGLLLLFLMVIIGGITRLTDSGLSMVDWKLFMGMVPPLNEQQWIDTFEQYKQYPEYQKVNFYFTLEEFKSIFFWEYLHRLLGRLLGFVFIIPFTYFLIRARLSKRLIRQCLTMMGMGAFQGFLGWWMVKSGLVNRPDVSHYRLATHLVFAFLTGAYIFYVILQQILPRSEHNELPKSIGSWLYVLFFVVLAQIVYGAFVAGLNAGFVINTWPKMDGQWIADSVTAITPVWKNFVEGIGGVQFVHRYLAYVVVTIVLILKYITRKHVLDQYQRIGVSSLVVIVSIQFLLGVLTLLYAVPVWLGVFHQVGAFVLLMSVVYSLHVFRTVKNQ